MVLASHVIFGTYGFWLPNDPRGSGSDFVGSWELFRYGKATKVTTRASVAAAPNNRQLRAAAKQVLKYPPVIFTGLQARTVARGFAESAARGNVTVYACAILPEHVHIVIARHEVMVEKIVALFKANATRQLILEKLHPFMAYRTKCGRVPTCWGENCWKVFLNSEEDVGRAIKYVQDNPIKDGKRLQTWSFVKPIPVSFCPGSRSRANSESL